MTTALDRDEIADLKSRLRARMDRLPQREAIREADANTWIDYAANVLPNEAMWHMTRAAGAGGSEIGVLVRNFLGFRADHEQSAHDWAMGKLLRTMPTPGSGVLLRGHVMEPIMAKMLYSDLGCVRDEAAFHALTHARSVFSWMRYSPDEMLNLSTPTMVGQGSNATMAQGRILVDYKAPSNVDASEQISFQYACQLHQGAILCEENGISLAGSMLVQLDYQNWTLKKDFITIDPDLCNTVKEAGTHYWGEVMQGRVPPYVVRQRINTELTQDEKALDLADKVATLRAMASRLTKASDEHSAKLLEMLGTNDLRFDGQSIVFRGALTVSAPRQVDSQAVMEALPQSVYESLLVKEKATKYDAAALVRKLKELGQDVRPFRVPSRIDPTLAFEAIARAGLDPEAFVVEAPRITVSNNAREQADRWYQDNFEQDGAEPVDDNESGDGDTQDEEEPVRRATNRPG